MVVPTLIRPSITAPIAADYISVIFGPDAQLALQCGQPMLVTHLLDTSGDRRLRQLGDVGGDAPGLVAGEEL
jgi:hypothetical protein